MGGWDGGRVGGWEGGRRGECGRRGEGGRGGVFMAREIFASSRRLVRLLRGIPNLVSGIRCCALKRIENA